MTMTADREEVVDFVAPYFEQTGITIGRYDVHDIFIFKYLSHVVVKKKLYVGISYTKHLFFCLFTFLLDL